MADIAILVAEEYERRIKSSSTSNNGDHDHLLEIKWISNLKAMEEKVQLVKKWVMEPKSEITVAASNGFFSA
ncbi:hypothetical protein M5689_013271 [Euphorbia peplus]|nr:hypothetical protein M5689_013271 [Euphorbia peplus]